MKYPPPLINDRLRSILDKERNISHASFAALQRLIVDAMEDASEMPALSYGGPNGPTYNEAWNAALAAGRIVR